MKPALPEIGEPMYVWVTKYALTNGIKKCLVRRFFGNDYVVVEWKNGLNGEYMINKKEVAFSAAESISKATEMKFRKINSLNKQIDKLIRKTFTTGE